jgi:uncharacterized membrane protein YeaQ/YmgE (transglycosylase-associated protein family)
MSIFGWIFLGLIAGFIASKIVNKQGSGIILDIILGVIGAVVGGWLFSFFGADGVTGFNIYSMVVAVLGAVVVLLGLSRYHWTHRVIEERRNFWEKGLRKSGQTCTITLGYKS